MSNDDTFKSLATASAKTSSKAIHGAPHTVFGLSTLDVVEYGILGQFWAEQGSWAFITLHHKKGEQHGKWLSPLILEESVQKYFRIFFFSQSSVCTDAHR